MKKSGILRLVFPLVFFLTASSSARTEDVSVFAAGKISVNKRIVFFDVTSARRRDNMTGLSDLSGKSLKVVGAKVKTLERLVNRDVVVRGVVTDDTEINVVSVDARNAAGASPSSGLPAKEQTRGAIGAVGRSIGAVKGPDPLVPSGAQDDSVFSIEQERKVDRGKSPGAPIPRSGGTESGVSAQRSGVDASGRGAIGAIGSVENRPLTSGVGGSHTRTSSYGGYRKSGGTAYSGK